MGVTGYGLAPWPDGNWHVAHGIDRLPSLRAPAPLSAVPFLVAFITRRRSRSRGPPPRAAKPRCDANWVSWPNILDHRGKPARAGSRQFIEKIHEPARLVLSTSWIREVFEPSLSHQPAARLRQRIASLLHLTLINTETECSALLWRGFPRSDHPSARP